MSTDLSVMDESVEHPDRGPEDDHRNESRDQSRAKRPPCGESMHFGDTVQHDDTAPDCQHAFDDADLVKRRIDLEHLGCRRMRYCDALKDREQQDDLGGDRRNLPPGQRGPHFDPARDAAQQSSRPFQDHARNVQRDHAEDRRECDRERDLNRPQRRQIGGIAQRLRPLIRQRTDRRAR